MKYLKIDRKWLKANFVADYEKGVLIHKTGRHAGQIAGAENGEGYMLVKKSRKAWYIHRLMAQFTSYIDISNYHVHHLDNDKGNNRPENLVLLSFQQHAALRTNSGRQTLRYRGIVKKKFSYGIRYIARLTVAGVVHEGPKRNTQMTAWKDYCRLYAKHRGLVHAPADVLKTYLNS